MSPHFPFNLDEAGFRTAVDRLRVAGLEFVEERRQTYRVFEHGPDVAEIRGRLKSARGAFPAHFQSWNDKHVFVVTVTHDVEILDDVYQALGVEA